MRLRHVIFGLSLFALGALAACSRSSAPMASTAAPKTLYHCAMHPQIVSDKPGDCPICHMRLTRLDSGGTMPIEGQATIHLSPGIEQEIGVTMATAAIREMILPIRAAARVAYDPQLYNAALEHQETVSFLRKARRQGSADMIEQAESTTRSSELRLRQLGLSEVQIADVEKPDYDGSALLLGSKDGRVLVYASVYDDDANLIHAGQEVELTSPSMPGQIYHGTVRAMDRILDNDTRTLRVRIQVSNAAGTLRPETYLSATIRAVLGHRLTVPEEAVIDTGERQLVYVMKEGGLFEPREIRIGRRAGGYYEILSGLKPGEQVSSSANFLIDSESRIQAAAQEAVKRLSP